MTTIVGNLTSDPQLAFTNGGKAVCNLSVAINRRYQVQGEWLEQTTYLKAVAWNDLATNIATTCEKGTRVWLAGHLEPDEYESANKTVKSVKLVAGDGGISLQRCTATIEKVAREYVKPTPAGSGVTSRTTSADGPLHHRDLTDDEPF